MSGEKKMFPFKEQYNKNNIDIYRGGKSNAGEFHCVCCGEATSIDDSYSDRGANMTCAACCFKLCVEHGDLCIGEFVSKYIHEHHIRKCYMIVCSNSVRVVYWYKEFRRYLKDKIVRYNEAQHEYIIGDVAIRFVSTKIYETRARYGYRGEVIDEDSFESSFYEYLDKYGIWHPQSSEGVSV